MGVIGAEISRKFVNEGHRPVIFARHRDDSLIGDILDKVDFEQGDVLDMPRILQAIKKHRVTHTWCMPRPLSARSRRATRH
jgi:NAD(P)-dependent dehydrogenase (short-subunit alcohol dehydrogenase family)